MTSYRRDNLIWFRGEVVRESEANISVLSPTAQFGLNVFEGIRCYWNNEYRELYAFRLKDHLERLLRSCRLLRLRPPHNFLEIESFMRGVIAANDFEEDISVRLTVFVDGQGSWHSSDPVSMFIAPIAKARSDVLRIPVYSACISSWQRISDNVLPPRAKVGANYINGRYAHLQARQDGYDFPIFLGADGKVAEGAGACLFLVRDGQICTPDKTSSILESITRDTIMQIAVEAGMVVNERAIDRTELYLADEIFLCGSAAEISPITSVDGYVIGSGEVGEITKNLLTQYLEIADGRNARYRKWLTSIYLKN